MRIVIAYVTRIESKIVHGHSPIRVFYTIKLCGVMNALNHQSMGQRSRRSKSAEKMQCSVL